LKYTLEGTTSRARAAQQQLGLRVNGRLQARLMPESVYARAGNDHDEAIRLLKLYGWITDDAAITRGRALLAEQRRAAKNARARERRATQAAA
jgi:IS30 family transposase